MNLLVTASVIGPLVCMLTGFAFYDLVTTKPYRGNQWVLFRACIVVWFIATVMIVSLIWGVNEVLGHHLE